MGLQETARDQYHREGELTGGLEGESKSGDEWVERGVLLMRYMVLVVIMESQKVVENLLGSHRADSSATSWGYQQEVASDGK